MSFKRVARRNRIQEQGQKQRLCDKCLRATPREELELKGDAWICETCRTPGATPASDPYETTYGTGSRRTRVYGAKPFAPSAADEAYERAGVYLEYGLLIVRCVLYLIFFVAATKSDLARNAFQGFLVADFGAWLVQSLFEFKRDPHAVVLEFCFFGVVLWFFSDKIGLLSLPPAPTDRAVVGLVFLFYFSTRVIFFVLRRRYEGDGTPGAA